MDKQDANLSSASRMLAMLGGIVRASVRADSPDMLFREACRIAVECGLFRFAWVGLPDPAGSGIRMLASGGDAGGERGVAVAYGLAGRVQERGQVCVCKDVASQSPELRRAGVAAVAGLPLHEDGKVSGVLMLYASHRDCFDEATMTLLQEISRDISFSLQNMIGDQRRLAAESKLYYMAFYDAQTGLPNQALLEERLPKLAHPGAMLALLDIRLQRLDRALHLFGRLAMDDLLRLIGARLEALRGKDGFLAQLGQDEFALVVPGVGDHSVIEALARRMMASVEEPVRLGEREVFLRASVGAAIYPVHNSDITQLLRRARAAADYRRGEDGFCMFSSELDLGIEQRARTEAELHRALERKEFQLAYQPQISLRTGAMVGVEALLQWHHPQRGLVGPGEFISLLEECGLMPAVGTWVLREACRQAKAWQEQGCPPLRIGVNLSALQFRLADLVFVVRGALEEAGLAPHWLELELTESLILENVEQTIEAMHELKRLGVSLSLDDFGTGYSSLSYLRRYPVDRIKIDQSFIRDMGAHAGSAALVRSILAMAHNLGLQTIAEGVETKAQFEYLRKQPCDEMQGFLFSRAVPAGEIARMLAEGKRLLSDAAADVAYSAVLLVEDDAAERETLRLTLARDGWRVLSAGGADEALSLLPVNNVGVVVSGLPGAFMQRIRDMYPDTMRIFTPADAEPDELIDAVNRGEVYKVLPKPVNAERLQACIRDAFRRRKMHPG
ncbi:MAG TPA: EAL domain-containing protein [Noviherbaspirillum sp.]|nr:EAL domain-containing protein [Noviherbaspirillum sp.]